MPRKQGDSHNYFAMILYPEDATHMQILDYIKRSKQQFKEYAYILHDQDEIEQDEAEGTITDDIQNYKKAHYHVLVKYYCPKSTDAFLKIWKGSLSKVIGIHDVTDYLKYMTHTNWDSFIHNKHVYPDDQLKLTHYFATLYDVEQSSYFVQFMQVVNGISSTPTANLIEYLTQVSKMEDSQRNYILSILHSEANLVRLVCANAQKLNGQTRLENVIAVENQLYNIHSERQVQIYD
jgi:hypothetical protein